MREHLQQGGDEAADLTHITDFNDPQVEAYIGRVVIDIWQQRLEGSTNHDIESRLSNLSPELRNEALEIVKVGLALFEARREQAQDIRGVVDEEE